MDVFFLDVLGDAEDCEKFCQNLVTLGDFFANAFPFWSEFEREVWLIFYATVLVQALHHLGDRRLAELQGFGKIGNAYLVQILFEFVDCFQIIFLFHDLRIIQKFGIDKVWIRRY